MGRSDYSKVPVPGTCNWRLSRMPDMHHVAVLDDVILAFQAQRAFRTCTGFRARFQELIPANGFGANEMLLQIGGNSSGCFLGASVSRNLPGAARVFAGGKESDQTQQLVGGANEPSQTTLLQAI